MNTVVRKLILVALFTLIAVPSWAENSTISSERKSPIKRSMTGGSPMADVLKRGDNTSSEEDSVRAMLAPEKIEDSKKSNTKRRIPLARSGGSPSSSFATIEKDSEVK